MSTAEDQRAADGAFNPRCACRTLALTTTDASVTLPAVGAYELYLDASGPCVVGLNLDTTSLPSTTMTAGIGVVPGGGVLSIVVESLTLRARMVASTGTLYIVQKAAL